MIEKVIELLEKQINKLDEPKFDLGIWKNTTIIILDRIFGKNSEKVRQVQQINYDHSSWTLRDTSGASSLDVCKKLGKELLLTTIDELKVFGLPEQKRTGQVDIALVRGAMEDVLRISQYRELIYINQENADSIERKKKLAEKLQSFGDEAVREILAGILCLEPFNALEG
ncbi:MAG: hypothetical protein U1C46_05640 [Bacteroidales bacterium]|nr:hypothetical protein [Bacteroidales bacterium]MDZ4204284.1 hypothetical protein [Bacteroidales bacterium]